MLEKPEIKLKPWGREIWFAHTDKYAGKILEIKKGHRYSLQYHEHKEETQYILKGKARFTFGTLEPHSALELSALKTFGQDPKNLQEKILSEGDKIDIPPYTIHRLEAIEDTIVFEVSSPELDDVVKLDDDYGRSGKGNNEELDEGLANSAADSVANSPENQGTGKQGNPETEEPTPKKSIK
ncbi:MAG: hypothetical protein WC604_03980 [Candidatus Gracilibacteria bacterium]